MLDKYAKAIIGALVAMGTAVVTAMPDGIQGEEWVGIVLAFLVTLGAVWGYPNTLTAAPVPLPLGMAAWSRAQDQRNEKVSAPLWPDPAVHEAATGRRPDQT
jgi:hypothetical protein